MAMAPVEMMSPGKAAGYYGAAKAPKSSYNNATTTRRNEEDGSAAEGIVLVLRAGSAAVAFVAVALIASCRHGDWMEFMRYPEYR